MASLVRLKQNSKSISYWHLSINYGLHHAFHDFILFMAANKVNILKLITLSPLVDLNLVRMNKLLFSM